jgi:VWFA-related protein
MYSCRYAFALLAFAAVPIHSQTAVPDSSHAAVAPPIQAKVRAVVVDVVVTDGKGEPVSGLHQGDFNIFEEGKPQTVATFEEHHGASPTQVELPSLPPHVYTNFPLTQTADSLTVLLLDALNTPLRDQTYVHEQMIKYLGTIPPGTRLAIFTLASRLRMIQGVTADSAELLAVLKEKKWADPQPSALLPSSAETDANQQLIDFLAAEHGSRSQDPLAAIPPTSARAVVDPVISMKQFLADTAAFQTESRVQITLQALQQLARYLSDIPGRKNVVWFSGSFPTGILPDPDLPDPASVVRDFQQDVRRTTNLLASSQTAIYPIAAEGLASDSVYEANGGAIGQKRPSLAARDQIKQMQTAGADRDSNHITMEELAKDTGGQAFYNSNGLDDALTHVINNGTRFYTLTYSPSDKTMDGKFRRVRINLLIGKYNLAYRRGYFADDLGTSQAAEQKPDADPLYALMGRNLPDLAQVVYEIRVTPTNPQPAPDAAHVGGNVELKGPLTRYGVDFAISPQDLRLDPTPDGGRHGHIEVMLVAYDREGKPLNLVETETQLILPPKVYADVLKVGLQIHKEIDVPKQDVYLRTGIYDMGSDAAGTLGVPLSETATTQPTGSK